MKLYSSSDTSLFKKAKKKLFGKRLILILAILFGLGLFAFANILYGAYLNKTGQTSVLRMFMIRSSERDFSYVPNTIKSTIAPIEEITIDIKFKNWQKIKYIRERALIGDGINSQKREEVPAKIRYKNEVFKASISITGQTDEHIKHPSRWSFLVKIKDGKTVNGANKFAIIYPSARGYLTDWIAFKLLESQNLIGIKNDFVNVSINGKTIGLYYFEERFGDNLLRNNNRPEGLIFRLDGDLKIYQPKKIGKSPELSSQLIQLKKLLHLFLTDKISIDKIFDLEKFATLFVVSDILNQKHALFRGNTRLYYNPVTNLIEPIGREWGYLRDAEKTVLSLAIEKPNTKVPYHINLHKDPILGQMMSSQLFREAYIKKAHTISKPTYIDSILDTNKVEFDLLMNKIYKQNPFYKFPLDLLHENQEYMRLKLHPYPLSPRIDAFFESVNSDSIHLLVKNNTFFPIRIDHFIYNQEKIDFDHPILLEPNYKFDQIFRKVSISGKQIDLNTFSSDLLSVRYKVLGLEDLEKAIVFPKLMNTRDYLQVANTSRPTNIDNFNFLTVDIDRKTIVFSSSTCTIEKDLIIPKGYKVLAQPGSKIDLINSSKIISYSPVLFFGNENDPIEIGSSDKTGQGIIILNADGNSEFSYVNFKSLSNIVSNNWNLKSSFVLYESSFNLTNCDFEDSRDTKSYVCAIRSDFEISNTSFKNIYGAALNSEFSEGSIENTTFDAINGNAINAYSSKLHVNQSKLLNFEGIGFNISQNSTIFCENINLSRGKMTPSDINKPIVSIDKTSTFTIHSDK